MSDCGCESTANELAQGADARRRRTLWTVLVINVVLFAAELTAGILADSQALVADSADNLGDTLAYAMSLFVIGRSIQWRASAAMLKGLIQLAFGVGVAASIVIAILGEPRPVGLAMMGVAAVALIANLVCFALLLKHRGEDINMRSVWLCSRNDVIGNAAVILSGALVITLDSYWPDIIVASLVAAVFLHTAYEVIRGAHSAFRQDKATT